MSGPETTSNIAVYHAGFPVLFVVIGLAVRHEYYGVKDGEGHLLLYVRSSAC